VIYWHDHTWEEIKEKLSKLKAVILPIGSCEQHSLHLPLGTDSFGAVILSEKIARELEDKVLVLPPIWYGFSPHHMNFAGTITLSSQTLINLIVDIAKSLRRHGVKKLIIINGHGGNIPIITIALRIIREEVRLQAVLINPWELISDIINETLETKIWGHACEFETSLAFVQMPGKVRKDRIKKPQLKQPKVSALALWEKNKVVTAWNTDDITDTGSIGDPTKATVEKGKIMFDAMVERTLKFVKEYIENE